jgi:hypothetical protein
MPRNVATVEDFTKLKNELGLVPMEFLLDTITELKGDVRGAEPYTALRWYNEGLAQPLGKLDAAPTQAQQVQLDPEAERKGTIPIPDGIDDEHHLQRIAVAKKIVGSDASLTAEQADKIIQEELARRAAAATQDGAGTNVVTSQQTVTR